MYRRGPRRPLSSKFAVGCSIQPQDGVKADCQNFYIWNSHGQHVPDAAFSAVGFLSVVCGTVGLQAAFLIEFCMADDALLLWLLPLETDNLLFT